MSERSAQLPESSVAWEISPAAVAKWVHLPPDQRPRLIDCREEEELAICRIEGYEWFPLGTFSVAGERLTTDYGRGIVVYCHHGMRSMRAAAFLRAHGLVNTFSMQGGIEAWSQLIDPTVPRY